MLGFAFLEGAATRYAAPAHRHEHAGGRYDMAARGADGARKFPCVEFTEEVTGSRTKIQMPTWVWLGGDGEDLPQSAQDCPVALVGVSCLAPVYLPSGSGPPPRGLSPPASPTTTPFAVPRLATAASPHPGSATSRMTTPTARP